MPDVGVIPVGKNSRIRQSEWYQISRPIYRRRHFISLERARCEETAILGWMLTSLHVSLARVVSNELPLMNPSALRVASEAMYKYDA
jgi:hypothetical protein